MLSEKINKLRSELATRYSRLTYDKDHNGREAEAFSSGFLSAWALHEKLVGPLIDALAYTVLAGRDVDKVANAAIEKYKKEVGE